MFTRIAGHVFEGQPAFNTGYNQRGISFVVPIDTPNEVMEELKDADLLEVLFENQSVVKASYPLYEWSGMSKVYSKGHSGIAITWITVTLNEVDSMKDRITELEAENQALTEENTMLENAVLELAEIVGGEIE